MRLQKRWDAGGRISRNAMNSSFPFIGDESYTTCAERIANMTAVSGTVIGACSGG